MLISSKSDMEKATIWLDDKYELVVDSLELKEGQLVFKCSTATAIAAFSELLNTESRKYDSIYSIDFDFYLYGPIPENLTQHAIRIEPVIWKGCKVKDCEYSDSGRLRNNALMTCTLSFREVDVPSNQFTKLDTEETSSENQEDVVLFEYPDGLTEKQFEEVTRGFLSFLAEHAPELEISDEVEFEEVESDSEEVFTDEELDGCEYSATVSDSIHPLELVLESSRPVAIGSDYVVLFNGHRARNVMSINWEEEYGVLDASENYSEPVSLITGEFQLLDYVDCLDTLEEALGEPYTEDFNITLIASVSKGGSVVTRCMTLQNVSILSKKGSASARDMSTVDVYTFFAKEIIPWQFVE